MMNSSADLRSESVVPSNIGMSAGADGMMTVTTHSFGHATVMQEDNSNCDLIDICRLRGRL